MTDENSVGQLPSPPDDNHTCDLENKSKYELQTKSTQKEDDIANKAIIVPEKGQDSLNINVLSSHTEVDSTSEINIQQNSKNDNFVSIELNRDMINNQDSSLLDCKEIKSSSETVSSPNSKASLTETNNFDKLSSETEDPYNINALESSLICVQQVSQDTNNSGTKASGIMQSSVLSKCDLLNENEGVNCQSEEMVNEIVSCDISVIDHTVEGSCVQVKDTSTVLGSNPFLNNVNECNAELTVNLEVMQKSESSDCTAEDKIITITQTEESLDTAQATLIMDNTLVSDAQQTGLSILDTNVDDSETTTILSSDSAVITEIGENSEQNIANINEKSSIISDTNICIDNAITEISNSNKGSISEMLMTELFDNNSLDEQKISDEPCSSKDLSVTAISKNNTSLNSKTVICESNVEEHLSASHQAININSTLEKCDNSDDLLSELELELNSDTIRASKAFSSDLTKKSVTASENISGNGCSTALENPEISTTVSSSLPNCSDSINGDEENSSNVKSNTDSTTVTKTQQFREVETVIAVQEVSTVMPNGLIPAKITDIPEYKELKKKHERLQKFYTEKEMDVKRLSTQVSKVSDELLKTVKDRDVYIRKIEHLEENSAEKTYLQQISELKATIEGINKEHDETKQKLCAHDAAAKKHIQQLQIDTQAKITQITRVYEECKRDKEGMVVKYAMAEQKNLELQERMARNDRRVREMEREKDNMAARYKQIKTEKEKSDGNILSRGQEIVNLRRDIEKLKEIRTESESKAKWANNKLKTELEAHKETKQRLDDVTKKQRQLKEESDQVRRDCQSMIKEYQQTEGVKSMTLAVKLDEKQTALAQQQQEKKDQEEMHSIVKSELDTLKRKHKEMMEELRTYRDKVKCLDAERILQEETLTKFKNTLQVQKQDNRTLYEKLAALEKVDIEFGNAKTEIEHLKVEVIELTENNKDLRADIDGCAKREGGHLEFSKRVSDKNARLQSENSSLSNKLSTLQQEHDTLNIKCSALEETIEQLKEELSSEKHQRIKENGSLRLKLEERDRKVGDLSQEVEDQKDENKSIKRKHQANIKDLTRQLQQAKRKLEIVEGRSAANGERDSMGSMGSRTSSTNSMNTVGQNGDHNTVGGRGNSQEPSHPLPQEDDQPIVQFVDVDKQILVEKIVKLQRIHARKNEKLEFMEDHNTQLVEELQKKHRIIQSYALREETGALAPVEMDLNKAQLAKKGGIMASVYNRHAQDDHMTIDLSLEINRKLQAVLEDTLLKNITLKDNMDTLGKEIAIISQRNRELQLQIHKLREKTS